MSEEAPPLKRAVTLGAQHQSSGTCFAHTASRVFCKLVKSLLPDMFDAKETCVSSGFEMEEDYIKTIDECSDEKFKNYVCLYSYVVEAIKMGFGCDGGFVQYVLDILLNYTTTYFMLSEYKPKFRSSSLNYNDESKTIVPLIRKDIDIIARNLLEEFVIKKETDHLKIMTMKFDVRGKSLYRDLTQNWIKTPGKEPSKFIQIIQEQGLYTAIGVSGDENQLNKLQNPESKEDTTSSYKGFDLAKRNVSRFINKSKEVLDPILKKILKVNGSSGHAMTIKNWNQQDGTLTILNSWGPKWGDKGTQVWKGDDYMGFSNVDICGYIISPPDHESDNFFSFINNKNIICIENGNTIFNNLYRDAIYNVTLVKELARFDPEFLPDEDEKYEIERLTNIFSALLDMLASFTERQIFKIGLTDVYFENKTASRYEYENKIIYEVKIRAVYWLLFLLTIKSRWDRSSIDEAKRILSISNELFKPPVKLRSLEDYESIFEMPNKKTDGDATLDEDFKEEDITENSIILYQRDRDVIRTVRQQNWFIEFQTNDAYEIAPSNYTNELIKQKRTKLFLKEFYDNPTNMRKETFRKLYLILVGNEIDAGFLDYIEYYNNSDNIETASIVKSIFNTNSMTPYELNIKKQLYRLIDPITDILNSPSVEEYNSKIAEIKEKMRTATLNDNASTYKNYDDKKPTKIEYFIKAFVDSNENIRKETFKKLYLVLVKEKMSDIEINYLLDEKNKDEIYTDYLLFKLESINNYSAELSNIKKSINDIMQNINNEEDFRAKISEIKEKMATVTLEESPPKKEDRGGKRRTKKRRRTRRLNTRNRRGRTRRI